MPAPWLEWLLVEIHPHFLTCSMKQCRSWDDGAGLRVLEAPEDCPKQRVISPQELLSFIPETVMGP